MQEKNYKSEFRAPFLSRVSQRHKSVGIITMRWLLAPIKLLLRLMALLVLVLISPVYLILYYWNQGKVSSELSKALEEEFEKPRIKTSCRYGMSPLRAGSRRDTLRKGKIFTGRRRTRSLSKR